MEFDKINFKLIWSDHPTEKYYIQEYLPDGEQVGSFNQMLTIHLFDVDIKVTDAFYLKLGMR